MLYHYKATNNDSDTSKKYHDALKDISGALHSVSSELATHAFDRLVKALVGRITLS